MSRGFKHRLISAPLLLFSVVIAVVAGFFWLPSAVAVEADLLRQLTAAEIAWLNQQHRVRVSVVHTPPLISLGGEQPVGLLIDYLQKLTEEYGVQFEYVERIKSEAAAGVMTGQGPDLLPAIRPNSQRRQQLSLSAPYISQPLVIFTREEIGFIGDVADLAGHKVSVPDGCLVRSILQKKYPDIEVVVTDNLVDSLELLSAGKVDAYIGSLLRAVNTIKERGLTNIKVAAPAPLLPPEHVLAVRKDWPELTSLFNRILRRMSPRDHAEIRGKWLTMQYYPGIHRDDVVLWGSVGTGVVLLGFGLFLAWNRGLHAEVKRRKVTERALFDSVLRYRHLVQSVPHGIVEIGRAGEILFNNEPFCQLIGARKRNLQGHSFAEFVADKEQLTALLPQLTAAEIVPGHFTRQLELRSRQGRSVAVQIDFDRSRSVLDVQSAIIIITDLTRSLTAEKARDKNAELARELSNRIDEVEELNRVTLYLAEDLRSSNAELQQKTVDLSEANRDLESFAYSVSHDLRAPLRHIMGFAEILSDAAAVELSADNRRYLDKIKKSAGNMSRLINDLLTFSRAGRTELTFSEVDTDPLVKEEIENFAAETAGRQIDWQVGNLPVVTADLGTLRQVFNNLLENAVKYSSTREQAVIKVEAEQTGDEWIFAVHDNGAGFDPEFADKLFKVFSRLHRQDQFDGTGVGLAIVRRILQRHGGRIWAEGAVDQGAGFYFSLPIVKRDQS